MLTRAYQHSLNGSHLPAGEPLLEVDGVSLRFGGVTALSDISFTVTQGHVHAIIGPNGAGKSSMLNCISGIYHPQEGQIRLQTAAESGERTTSTLTQLPPHKIARLGVARSFQNIELFSHLTVLENLMLGRHIHMKHSVAASMLWFGPARKQEIAHRRLVEEVIDLLQLQAFRSKPVGALAYGIQKRVELGRALCIQPALLLLDEPMAGMNVEEKEDMARYVLDVHELAGVTVVLIEHDMNVVMDISDWVSVLDFGRLIADGTPDDVKTNPAVIEAYLGSDDEDSAVREALQTMQEQVEQDQIESDARG
ncbi:ABC transporter ATP-binding protein [Ornithinimicrobium pratense]|uniref:ABC transporter ATP-binding protein n=1 Tax=Ornithinimicrobium pratense TaxID=2593973 RepID=A0A5J6V597_9MICO|nr:ABC transporter ATP-binding protein [Ornithinimicrobium pratense]QFG68484.1 ABC transporter ATP-binding protein [Ornithinimicrobium pratense]